MSEEINDYEEDKESAENHIDSNESTETITRVTGMYKEWFLDYASYVILERAVPGINDGFKNWKVRWERVFTTVNLDGEPKSYRWYFLIGVLVVLIYSEFNKRKLKKR